ncbi:hypothetical protein DFH28DRAFT_1178981 [Melampsora americana]|nr:hypothetical protein DFH28DRAFT_1178981 [Melampsora americana]
MSDLPRFIVEISKTPLRYQCDVCTQSRTMKSYHSHVASAAHLHAAESFLISQAENRALRQGFETAIEIEGSPTPPDINLNNYFEDNRDHSNQPDRPPSPLTLLRSFISQTDQNGYDSDDSDMRLDFDKLREAFHALDSGEDDIEDEAVYEEALEQELAAIKVEEAANWYPFKKKEHVVALLMIGSNRNLLLRTQYQRIRSLLRVLDVTLPEWGTLRALVKRIKDKLDLKIRERTSPLGNPLFGLDVKTIISNLNKLCNQELANPLVSPHMVYVPELAINGPINRLSQCEKWHEDYPPDLCVQMISSNNVHYYIYEPVQLQTQHLVVPVFFFQQNGCLMARCLPAVVKSDPSHSANLKVIIPEDCAFDSEMLFTIPCQEFWNTFGDIEIENGVPLQRLCGNYMYHSEHETNPCYPIENPWRSRAQGKIIRHVPLALYSDDTSGNVSKKWNKHMSIYFTLAGLPPNLSNQEFNIHFLATSNCATALELFDQVVDDLNDYSTNGFFAYDHSLGKDVMVMAVALFHLGDSPMHAEISNTLNPANTLTPCRMCDLHVSKQADKQTENYVRDFLGLDEDGEKCLLPGRDWNQTRRWTKEMWNTSQKRYTKTRVEAMGRDFGVRDPMNDFFQKLVQVAHETKTLAEVEKVCQDVDAKHGEHIFNPMLRLKGFDGHKDTPVEVLHVVLLGIAKYLFRDTMKELGNIKAGSKTYNDLSGRWRAFNSSGLNIPPIQPNTMITYYQSLVGKEFRTVLQAVPFVLFEYLTDAKRELWTSLCLLSSYIFQTEIPNMVTYLAELDIRISIFLKHLVALNARWVNKPKFHMLVHLQESIQRFGPACLFATEKLESFNGVTRHASIHSNHQSPGQDIANTSNTQQMMRVFISGSSFFDKELQTRVFSGPCLKELLSLVPELYQAMGLDRSLGNMSTYCIGHCIPSNVNRGMLKEHESIKLKGYQKAQLYDFVLVTSPWRIGQIQSIWKLDRVSDSHTHLVLKLCQKGPINNFYGMRGVKITEEIVLTSVKDVVCVLNIQHNCHDSKCNLAKNHHKKIERRVTTIGLWGVDHVDSKEFILNAASHYSGALHRQLSELQLIPVSTEDWDTAIHKGIKKWKSEP